MVLSNSSFVAAIMLAASAGIGTLFATAGAETTADVSRALPAAPDFTATTIEGVEFDLSEVNTEKTIVLEWSNHQCPFVVKHYATPPANMQNLQARNDEDSVVWVTIVSSAPGKQGHISKEQAAELTTSRGAKPDHIILDEDGRLGKLYSAKTTPHMYIIDEGKLVYQGAIDSIQSARVNDIEKANNYVAASLDALASGDLPDPNYTDSYGCSIKY